MRWANEKAEDSLQSRKREWDRNRGKRGMNAIGTPCSRPEGTQLTLPSSPLQVLAAQAGLTGDAGESTPIANTELTNTR
jgi:uncharacterized protein (DUF2345 family)